jgi:hypothetical protein
VLPASADAEVGREPTVAVAAGVVGKWGHDGTPSGTSGSTTRRSCHNLPLLCLHDDDIADKFWE